MEGVGRGLAPGFRARVLHFLIAGWFVVLLIIYSPHPPWSPVPAPRRHSILAAILPRADPISLACRLSDGCTAQLPSLGASLWTRPHQERSREGEGGVDGKDEVIGVAGVAKP